MQISSSSIFVFVQVGYVHGEESGSSKFVVQKNKRSKSPLSDVEIRGESQGVPDVD